jgi:indole-3-acetate monooxygenase
MTDTMTATVTADGVRPAVTELLPDFRARALEAERLGTMPADLVRRAQAAGLFRLNLPRSLGGLELDPASTAEIFEEISRADGSAGWTVVIGLGRDGTSRHRPGAGLRQGQVRHRPADLPDLRAP